MIVGCVVVVVVFVWCAVTIFGIERGVLIGGGLSVSGVMYICMFHLYIVCVWVIVLHS